MTATETLTKEDIFKQIADNGINVDLEGLAKEKGRLQAEEFETLTALDLAVDFEGLRRQFPGAFVFKKRETPRFNPRSRKHLGAYFDREGISHPHSFALAHIEPKLPANIFELVERSRKLRKWWGDLGTLRDHVSLDGKIHVEWSEAKTGRWYTGAPPIQTMSKICREFLIPDEGNQFWIIDWRQQELRLLAYDSQEPEMLAWFEQDQDPHIGAFELVTGRSIDSLESSNQKDARDLGKTLNYALIYGLDAQGLGSRLRVDNETAQKLIHVYFQRLPVLTDWRKEQRDKVRQLGYVETMGGRQIPVELETDRRDAEERLGRKAINYRIQGSAAEQLIDALRRVNEMGMLDRVRATIHDALLIETFPGASSMAEIIAQSMRLPFMGVWNPVDVKGPAITWAQAMDFVEPELPEDE